MSLFDFAENIKFELLKFSLSNKYKNKQPKKDEKDIFVKKFGMGEDVNKSFYKYKPSHTNQEAKYKVFKPKSGPLETQKNNRKFKPKIVKFAFLEDFLMVLNRFIGSAKSYLFRMELLRRFNRMMAYLTFFVFIGFFVYLCFFDTFFLIKNYTITFEDGSFLDQSQMQTITEAFSEKKFLGIIPSNQYWFLSSQNLTFVANSAVPEVSKIEVLEHQWPNKVKLKLQTKPVLITLAVIENNQKKYWRVNQEGEIISEDTLGLKENLVVVERNITFDKPNVNLKDYFGFSRDKYLNRFWFVLWLWSQLQDQNINYTSTTLPSIVDTDVIIKTTSGTKLIFNSETLTKQNQKKRLESIFKTQIRDKESKGEISYIDFRVPKKIFICNKGKECENS